MSPGHPEPVPPPPGPDHLPPVTVVGATGGTGQQVVEQALARGHTVTAVARRPEAVTLPSPRLRVVRGDVTDPASLTVALAESGAGAAVVVALGVRDSRAPTTLFSAGAAVVVAAMQERGLRRLVVVTAGASVRDPADPPIVRLVVKPVLLRLFPGAYADMARMEAVVGASGLDWTVVRPARLTDGPRTGRYRVVAGGAVPGGWRVARADVADLILARLGDPAAVGAALAVAY